MSKAKSIVILTVLAILIAFFGAASFVSFEIPNSTKDYKSIFGTIGKGIDLEGGYYAVLTPKDGSTANAEEIDAVIELKDGRWCAFEIKLGANQIDKAAENLIDIRNKIITDGGNAPSVLCVVCGLSNAAYIRPDGVFVVPVTALKN